MSAPIYLTGNPTAMSGSTGDSASLFARKPTPVYKDSISHPLNVSWIIPPWLTPVLNQDLSVPGHKDLMTFARQEAGILYSLPPDQAESFARKRFPNWKPRGNMGLSSCPGKKVRLDGPVNGRAKIVRDLDLDFDRLQKLGFTRVVCCLFDEELEMLGSPFPKYLEAANSHGLDVVRIPMVEGSTPFSFTEMDRVLDRIDETTKAGQSVLVHCRGGVGRAAVVACCWLLRLQYFERYNQVIDFVRTQRSVKAIETKEQEHFVQGFQYWTKDGAWRETTGAAFENEIQKRINWAEAGMAKARQDAAEMNQHLSKRHSGGHELHTDRPNHTTNGRGSTHVYSHNHSYSNSNISSKSNHGTMTSAPPVALVSGTAPEPPVVVPIVSANLSAHMVGHPAAPRSR
ncbi:hypothetical protein BGZ92_002386 [Podila epicladia]|nr:hypothetical protein BGZ92_002386 [Podila epicladia]